MPAALHCPVCQGAPVPLGAVDFNKNCEEARGRRLPPAGRLVKYVICRACGFAWAPEFAAWTPADFQRDIYNAGYGEVDRITWSCA
jgi:2-polyprenyl-6-hydroxyphenyl methylase/3-demethylubiquinone-9 3-methyltransferase